MNVQAIIDQASGQIGDSGHNLVTNAQWISYINDGQDEIARKTHCLQETLDRAVTANDEGTPVPELMVGVEYAELDGMKIEVIKYEDLNLIAPGRNASTERGTPRYLSIWSDDFYYYPRPSADGTLRLFYTRLPNPVAAVNDTPELPSRFHKDLVRYCIARAKELDEDQSASEAAMAEFTLDLITTADEIQNPSQESYPSVRLLPGDD